MIMVARIQECKSDDEHPLSRDTHEHPLNAVFKWREHPMNTHPMNTLDEAGSAEAQ